MEKRWGGNFQRNTSFLDPKIMSFQTDRAMSAQHNEWNSPMKLQSHRENINSIRASRFNNRLEGGGEELSWKWRIKWKFMSVRALNISTYWFISPGKNKQLQKKKRPTNTFSVYSKKAIFPPLDHPTVNLWDKPCTWRASSQLSSIS